MIDHSLTKWVLAFSPIAVSAPSTACTLMVILGAPLAHSQWGAFGGDPVHKKTRRIRDIVRLGAYH